MRLITPLLVALFLLCAPQAASATCGIDCQATLMDSDCTTPPPGIWYAGAPLTFLGSCETCCSPPGGPVECDSTPMEVEHLYVKKDGEVLPGAFAQAGATCDDAGNMFLYIADDGPLVPGSYELIEDQSKLILVQFEVVEKVEIVEEIAEVVEPVDAVDVLDPPDIVAELIEEVIEDHGAPDPVDAAAAPDTPAPADGTSQDAGDAGYVVCGTNGNDGTGGCAAAPVAAAPWWLLPLAVLGLRGRAGGPPGGGRRSRRCSDRSPRTNPTRRHC